MKKQTLLKNTLCLLMALVCNVAWAQDVPVKQTSAPEDGYYLMYSESSSGEGWVHYNKSLSARKFRVATDVDLTNGVNANQANYVWKLVNDSESGTFTLQNEGEGVYMPADASHGDNMGATTTANLKITAVGGDGNEGKWYVAQTNNKFGDQDLYIHTNTPGGYPNLSYWEDCSLDGTSIRAQFYKVPEATYTLQFFSGEEQVATSSLDYPAGIEMSENLISDAVPMGYRFLSYTLNETTYTVQVTPEAFLTVSDLDHGVNYPYTLSEEQETAVFGKELLTIAMDVTMGGTSNNEAFICASDVSETSDNDTYDNTSTFVAVGTQDGNIRLFASAKSGGYYSGSSQLVAARNHKVVIVIDSKNETRTVYVDGAASTANHFQDFYHFRENENAHIYIGGGKNSAGDKYKFSGIVHSVQFFEGALTVDQLSGGIEYPETAGKAILAKAVTTNANMNIYGLQRYLGLVQNAGTGLEGNGQIKCNFPAATSQESGNAYANLIDGTFNTFFHSGYNNSVANTLGDGSAHYLQVDLGKAVKSFRFYTKKRNLNNNNNRPTKITIEGSNDAEVWLPVTIVEGIPTTFNDFYSAEITSATAYKHYRFTVNTTSTSSVFFTFSEFYILPNTPKVAATFDAVRAYRAGANVATATALNEVYAWNDMLTKGEPVVGKESYIYADTYKDGAFLNRYLYSNNGTLTLNTALQLHTDNYIWTPAKNGEKYNFANKADGYLAHKGMSVSEHNFTVAPTTRHLGVTLHTEGSNYFVIHNANGQFDQASGTYDQTTQAYCTDFVFVPTDLYEGVYALTIYGEVDGTATFNGETKALPATFYVTEEIDEENAMVTVAINDKTWRLTNITDASSNVVENLKVTSLTQNITYTVNVEPNITHGGLYYIYNDNDTRQYFYNDGGTLKVSENRTDWDNKYLFTCIKSGNNVQFKNAKGKYLKHQGLQDAAYNFELREYTYNGDKRVALYSVAANKYFVMQNNGNFSQADDPFHAEAGNYSTSYKFEEVAFYPKDGETYYIYSDTYQEGEYVNRYLYADGSNLKLSTFAANSDEYKWTCTVDAEGKVQFQNGKGKYLKHRGLQDAAYQFTVGRENAKHNIAATLYSIDDSRYFVVNNDGSGFNQSSVTYNQTTDAYCTDFVFLPVNEVNLLSINGDPKANATVTWNGETKSVPSSWAIHEDLQSATSGTLTITTYTHTLSSFKEGETIIDGNQVDIANIVTDRSFTTVFTPAFFSATYGEKWVNIVRATNASHAAILGNNTENTIPTYNTLDYSDEGTLWCFVGTADNFKIYNKKSATLALTQGGTPANGVTVKMTAAGSAISWYLKEYADGYAIAPVGNNNFGMNSYGGTAGNEIKFYGIGDAGSHWNFNVVDINKTLTFGIEVDNVWESSPRVAELAFTVNGVKTTTRVLNSVDEKIYYLPVGSTFSISSATYRGYTFNGFGNDVESYENQTIPEGGLDITASYTANDERTLFYSPRDGHPYRIPAIATAPNGDIFAICDYRPCGADIGNGDVDIVVRISTDNGETWGDEFKIADGDGGNSNRMETGYGDPAIVVDRESNKILVMMVAGRTVCTSGDWNKDKMGVADAAAVNRAARVYGTYNEETNQWDWTEPEEVTDDIYKLFLDENDNATVTSMFIGSGKICQSRVVKKDQYYRLYCALWTHNGGNRVLYSDDFGGTWNVLGTITDRPASSGNEPKCEELPDGSVVLSSRVSGGRFFNIFTFNNDGEYTTGSWGTVAKSTETYDGSSQGTNGEIYKVKAIRKSDGQICDVMLQSVPAGPGRSNVKVYYKEMEYNEDGTNEYTPETFATGWTVGKHVSEKESCYSTMILQADGRIGFFFEEVPGGYCMVYIPYTIEDLTAGQYSLYTVTSTITDIEIGTFYASEAMQIPDGVKAFVADENNIVDGVITMTRLEGIIPAHTGVVLRGAADDYEFIPSISYGKSFANNLLVGHEAANSKDTDENRLSVDISEANGDIYVLATDDEGNAQFYKKEANFTVKNNKAYLQVPQAMYAKGLRVRFAGDETTSVDMPTTNGQQPTAVYDLQGRRVLNPTKGIYIVNGKKVIVK